MKTKQKKKCKVSIQEDGEVKITSLVNKEEKKKKILKALLATGISKEELPALTVELLAERIRAIPFSGLKALEASSINPTASAMVGACL